MSEKEDLQENQYNFPYHHLPHEEDGGIFIFRHLFWGLVHLTYIKYVINEIKSHNPETIADVGCGEGRIICELNSFIRNNSLAGYDISEKAISFAKAFNSNIKYKAQDITKAPLEGKYHAIVSCEVIEHIKPDEVDSYCRNISESLHNGGVFFLTTPTTNVPTNKKHYQHFTKETLMNYLDKYFELEKVTYLNCVNFRSKLLERILSNRFYLSNSKLLNRWILKTYRKKFLIGNKKTGSRIYLKLKKK